MINWECKFPEEWLWHLKNCVPLITSFQINFQKCWISLHCYQQYKVLSQHLQKSIYIYISINIYGISLPTSLNFHVSLLVYPFILLTNIEWISTICQILIVTGEKISEMILVFLTSYHNPRKKIFLSPGLKKRKKKLRQAKNLLKITQ